MVEKDDWRLSVNDGKSLKGKYFNPTDGEEISKNTVWLKSCEFCLEPLLDNPYQKWFIPTDLSCCICENCFYDFQQLFQWKKLDGWDIEWKRDLY